MKKLLFSVMVLVSTIAYTSAQNPSVGESPEASHWSIALKGGGTHFRVSPAVPYPPYFGKNIDWGAGLTIERTSNPVWGMGLDVNYLNYNIKGGYQGKTIDPTLFGAVNISNLFFPHRESAFFNTYLKMGTGASIWKNNYPNAVDNGNKGKVHAVFTFGVHPEIALGSVVALGAEVGYRYYATETLGGMVSKDRGDDALTAMLSLRFNLGADHVRNMTMDEYYPAPAPVVMQNENPYDDSQIINRLDNLDRQAQDIQNRLNKLENDVKDLANRPAGSSVNMSFENIEFDFDSSNITQASFPILDQIVSILKNNPTWGTLKIKGHTDSTGPEGYNQTLSENRAASVKDYLVNQGISASIMSTQGFGEAQPVASNDTKAGRQANRRVEFEIIK